MPVNLQRHTGRDMSELEAHLKEWFAHDQSALGQVVSVADARYVEGAGSANETIVANCRTVKGGVESTARIVIRLTVPSIAAYLDVDLDRQANILSWVGENTDTPVPTVYGVENDSSVLGAPFIVLERLEGSVPSDYPVYNDSGFVAEMSLDQRRQLWTSAVDTMSGLHRADASTIDFLQGDLESGLSELVDYWQRMFDWIEERVRLDNLRPFIDWLKERLPTDSPRGLSWGDARIGNMMFREATCCGVLDWEMVSLGGPVVDLAWWLMFDINHSDDSGLTRLDGLGGREETIERWSLKSGHEPKNLDWHSVFSLFQLAALRANAFEGRARLGLPVPDDDDPRSVIRLVRRMETILG